MAPAFLNIYNTKEPPKLLRDHRSRKKGFLYSYDASKTKIRKQYHQEIGSNPLYKLLVNHGVTL